MKKIRYDRRIQLFLIVAVILLVLLCVAVAFSFRTGEEATVGIFSLAATLLGTIFIAVELKNSQNVTCSDMLIDLNNYFHDSDRLMNVYEVLEECAMAGDTGGSRWTNVRNVEVAQYCTFFENLYLLYRHHVAEIEDLDDLFGYRFFLFMNNPYVQEHYILPTSSSYTQVFALYEVWIKYRRRINSCAEGWERHVPGTDFIFPMDYLERKLYLHDHGLPPQDVTTFESRGATFSRRRLSFADMRAVSDLQQRVVDALPDASLFAPLTRAEMLESMQLDRFTGIFDAEGRLVAFSLVVINRPGPRNLADGTAHASSTYTFDVVVVDPTMRGYGFQQHLIDTAVAAAREDGIDNIMATVAPDNLHSRRNFIAKGFESLGREVKYGGLERDVLRLRISNQLR